MSSVIIQRTPGQNKEFVAYYTDPKMTIRFGTPSNYVLNSQKTEKDRQNYIKRHAVNEDYDNPRTAGALSRWLLWGTSRSIRENAESFGRRFGLKVSVK